MVGNYNDIGTHVDISENISSFTPADWWIYLIIGILALIFSGIIVLKVVSKNKKKDKVVYENGQEK